MEVIKFEKSSIDNVLAKLDSKKIGELTFGAIEIDKNGTIISYNAAEGDITGRDPKDVIGKNFFKEVAPCTNKPEFYGKFVEGVKSGKLDTMFEYLFDYNMKPTKVKVYMKKSLTNDNYWIFVNRIIY